MELFDRVKDIIVREWQVPEGKVTESASFFEDLSADSLDQVELVMKFEDEFDIEIPEEDAAELRTVGDAVRYLQGKVAG